MKKKILVAPLNWGLGHATRCIPIINALLITGFEPIIASDGAALELLRKEFPDLTCLELPGYNINYSKKAYLLKVTLLKDTPKIINAIRAERKATKRIVETYKIDGIISDNRFGVYNELIPSVFMTHQLQVLSGHTTWLSTKIHQKLIKSFDQCWVPDNLGSPNLSGKLGHATLSKIVTKYIGPLSRLKTLECKLRYDVLVLLSGPEPQRGMLEEKLLNEFKKYEGQVLFVKGLIEKTPTVEHHGNMTVCDYLLGSALEKALNESDLIVSRSGYTTIMDLAKLRKKAFFIPTPGQFEQEYLAEKLKENKSAPYCKQADFNLEKLKEIKNYDGLQSSDFELNYEELFQLF